ncbi:MAG TPA: hypothetical protein VHO46_15490 [Bacteroidales bacterium]|nr:hypothetical protein [Bacteroidales bacterium]
MKNTDITKRDVTFFFIGVAAMFLVSLFTFWKTSEKGSKTSEKNC